MAAACFKRLRRFKPLRFSLLIDSSLKIVSAPLKSAKPFGTKVSSAGGQDQSLVAKLPGAKFAAGGALICPAVSNPAPRRSGVPPTLRDFSATVATSHVPAPNDVAL